MHYGRSGQWNDMRILVADDDGTGRVLLKGMVTKLGHECLVAEDGVTAWELLSSRPFDVLLTDWMMPGMDGPELCRRVREVPAEHYVYIVLTTGLDHPEHVLQGMSAGADDYLIKPLDSFAVRTRLVAAERVTELHGRLARKEAELHRLNEMLLERSLTDQLTGVGNRRRMDEDLEHAHARAARMDRTYGVALFDIDHFKRYNDFYGHLEGDETLRRVAGTIAGASRAGESAFRYGGEEFLLLVPDCRPADAIYTTAERIRQAVFDLSVTHESRQSGPPVVTLSGGVACWTPGSTLCAVEIVEQADKALFEAKSAGRNRIHAGASLSGVVPAIAGPSR
jgi:two-component system cell cycle response regulator